MTAAVPVASLVAEMASALVHGLHGRCKPRWPAQGGKEPRQATAANLGLREVGPGKQPVASLGFLPPLCRPLSQVSLGLLIPMKKVSSSLLCESQSAAGIATMHYFAHLRMYIEMAYCGLHNVLEPIHGQRMQQTATQRKTYRRRRHGHKGNVEGTA